MKTAQELLIPRIMCTAPFLGMEVYNWSVGHIITTEGVYFKEYPENYPTTFRRLEWHEFRAAEDMPEYVKTKAGNSVRKVDHFELWWNKVVLEGGKVRPINQWLPASREEYEQYINNK